MPGNTVKINNQKNLEWYVGDSKMGELIKWLNTEGLKNQKNKYVDDSKMDERVKWLNTEELRDQKKIDLFGFWLEEINPYGEKFVEVLYDEGQSSPKSYEFRKKVRIYSCKYVYTILVIDRSKDDGYLGCVVSNRKPRAGEDWIRGNDLPDGPFIRETWEKIKNAIIRHELVTLVPKAEEQPNVGGVED